MSNPNPVIVAMHEVLLKRIRHATANFKTPVEEDTFLELLEAFIHHFPTLTAALEADVGYDSIHATYSQWRQQPAVHWPSAEQQQAIVREMYAVLQTNMHRFQAEPTTTADVIPPELPNDMLVEAWHLSADTSFGDVVGEHTLCSQLAGYEKLPWKARSYFESHITIRAVIDKPTDDTWHRKFLRLPDTNGKMVRDIYRILVENGLRPTLQPRKR